jgi:hypothetical protein
MNDFEIVGKRGFYRPGARAVTLEQGFELILQATRHAREQGLADLVVNTLGLTGFDSPGVVARYGFYVKLVECSGAALRVVLVVRPDLVDFQKIGVLIFQNRGGRGDTFTSEVDALAWLDAGRAPRDRLPHVTRGVPPTN